MKKKYCLLIALLGFFIVACHKDSTPAKAELILGIKHQVDGSALDWNTIKYLNAAGNEYSVDRLQYYLSNFRFYKNNKLVTAADSVFYIDAQDSNARVILPQIYIGNYDSIAFYIGLDEQKNISNALPATMANINMGWPDAMGGGYHFLKLEGHWIDSTATVQGYAMHIGMNGFQVAAGIACNFNIKYNVVNNLSMVMNINEWFRNPYPYNFSTDGVFSMGDTTLMKKLGRNGADVFKVSQ